MLRWVLAVAFCLSSGCKVVTSTPGADAGMGGGAGVLYVGFAGDGSRVYETSGSVAIPVSLSGPTSQTLRVTYSVTPADAEEDVDYYVNSSTRELVFAPGDVLTQYIYIDIANDGIDESDESFRVDLESLTGDAVFDRRQHWVTIATTIIPLVSFSAVTNTVLESTSMSIGFTMTEPTNRYVSVRVAVSGTAGPEDYEFFNDTAVFEPGTIGTMLPLGIVDDTIDEDDESIVFQITLVDGGEIGSNDIYTHVIRDNDASPTVYFPQFSSLVEEGNSGSANTQLTVALSSASTRTVSVPVFIDTASSTATSGSDFTLLSTSLTFFAGQTTAILSVNIAGDTTVEGRESISVRLGTPTNAVLGNSGHVITIRGDDCIGTGVWAACPDVAVPAAIALPNDFSTDFGGYCQHSSILRNWSTAGQPVACVVVARTITAGTLRVTGQVPLVLVALDSIHINGAVRVGGQYGYASPGGGLGCLSTGVSPGPQAGGAGGSFITSGGNGADHRQPNTTGGPAPSTTLAPTVLRGGCDGQLGGDNFVASGYGHAGGGIYLVAGSAINISPSAGIDVSGGPALAGTNPGAGGSGGGSGGMIELFAPTINANQAFLVANGGAGSEGADASGSGASGSTVDSSSPFVPAPGGSGGSGGDGGNGYALGSAATAGAQANNNNGAGGGGGGGGFIRANRALTGASVSPAPVITP